jgi:hypothetical protein
MWSQWMLAAVGESIHRLPIAQQWKLAYTFTKRVVSQSATRRMHMKSTTPDDSGLLVVLQNNLLVSPDAAERLGRGLVEWPGRLGRNSRPARIEN